MKKISVFVFLFVAIASFGGILHTVHADTLTPAEAASMQATITSLKAELAQLQAQAAAQASAPAQLSAAPVLTMTVHISPISAQDAALLSGALTSLSAMLSNLHAQLSQNPQLAAQNAPLIQVALKGMSKTIASIDTIASGIDATPVAKNAPQPTLAEGSLTPQAGEQVISQSPSVQISPAAQDANTAQVSTVWSRVKSAWQYILVGLIVIGGLIMWFRQSDDSDDKNKKKKSNSGTPAKPAPITPMIQASQSTPPPIQGKSSASPILHS